VLQIDPCSSGLAGVAVGEPVAAADRVEDVGTTRRPRAAGSGSVTVIPVSGAVRAAWTVDGFRAAVLAVTRTKDTDTGGTCQALVGVGTLVAPADRIENPWADVGPPGTATASFTVAGFLEAEVPARAVRVVNAVFFAALTVAQHTDARSGGLAGVAVGESVAAADGIEDLTADSRAGLAKSLAVAFAVFPATVGVAWTVGVGGAVVEVALTVAQHTDARSGGLAGVAVGEPVAAADGVPDVRASGRDLLTSTRPTAISDIPGAVLVPVATLVRGARSRLVLAGFVALTAEPIGRRVGATPVRTGCRWRQAAYEERAELEDGVGDIVVAVVVAVGGVGTGRPRASGEERIEIEDPIADVEVAVLVGVATAKRRLGATAVSGDERRRGQDHDQRRHDQ